VGLRDQGLRGIRIRIDLLLGQAQRHADGDEPGLHAVVEVALDAGALDVGGAHRSGTLDARRASGLGELGFAGGHHDGSRDDAVQDAEADDRREGEQRGEKADGDRP
jgi:hypothetical protein